MKRLVKLAIIGVMAGTVLAAFLKIIQLLTGKQSYVLLFNMDYIPLLKNFDAVFGMGYLFHFVFCIVSVLFLYYLLKLFRKEKSMIAYIILFTLGSATLYSLTALTEQPPSITDFSAWGYWSLGHTLFGIVVGFLVKKMV